MNHKSTIDSTWHQISLGLLVCFCLSLGSSGGMYAQDDTKTQANNQVQAETQSPPNQGFQETEDQTSQDLKNQVNKQTLEQSVPLPQYLSLSLDLLSNAELLRASMQRLRKDSDGVNTIFEPVLSRARQLGFKQVDLSSFVFLVATEREFVKGTVELHQDKLFASAELLKSLLEETMVWRFAIDNEAPLGLPEADAERYATWIRVAQQLGCHHVSLSVDARGNFQQQVKEISEKIVDLYLATYKGSGDQPLKLLVENTNRTSADGQWLHHLVSVVNEQIANKLKESNQTDEATDDKTQGEVNRDRQDDDDKQKLDVSESTDHAGDRSNDDADQNKQVESSDQQESEQGDETEQQRVEQGDDSELGLRQDDSAPDTPQRDAQDSDAKAVGERDANSEFKTEYVSVLVNLTQFPYNPKNALIEIGEFNGGIILEIDDTMSDGQDIEHLEITKRIDDLMLFALKGAADEQEFAAPFRGTISIRYVGSGNEEVGISRSKAALETLFKNQFGRDQDRPLIDDWPNRDEK